MDEIQKLKNEIDSEIICLQGVGVPTCRDHHVLFVERANELAVSGKAKGVKPGAVAKASANSAF